MENEVKVEENVTTKEVQQKEEVEKTKRKIHGPLYWIIVIVGVALIVYLSMGIGEKLGRLATLESDNKETTKEEKENKEITREDAKKYVDDFKDYFPELTEKGYTDETKLSLVFGILPKESILKEKEIKCIDAFDNCKVTEEGTFMEVDEGFAFFEGLSTILEYDELNKYYKKIFGSKSNAPKINANPAISSFFAYSNKLNAWVQLEAQFGGACMGGENIYYVIDSAQTENNKLVIKLTYFEYIEVCEPGYSEEELAKMEYTEEDGYGYLYEMDGVEKKVLSKKEIPDIVTKNHDKLPHLTFTFEKENDNYILTSVTK